MLGAGEFLVLNSVARDVSRESRKLRPQRCGVLCHRAVPRTTTARQSPPLAPPELGAAVTCSAVIRDPDREDERAANMWEFGQAVADFLGSEEEHRVLKRRALVRKRRQR